eukprot:scaffold25719_cov84-Isochrysis_galbana.AAC.2
MRGRASTRSGSQPPVAGSSQSACAPTCCPSTCTPQTPSRTTPAPVQTSCSSSPLGRRRDHFSPALFRGMFKFPFGTQARPF